MEKWGRRGGGDEAFDLLSLASELSGEGEKRRRHRSGLIKGILRGGGGDGMGFDERRLSEGRPFQISYLRISRRQIYFVQCTGSQFQAPISPSVRRRRKRYRQFEGVLLRRHEGSGEGRGAILRVFPPFARAEV